MKLKKYKKKKISSYFSKEIIIVILSIIISLFVINSFDRKVDEVFVPMAETIIKKYVSMMINNATEEIIFDEELFTIDRNENNEIKMVTYNSFEVTKLINEITYNIQEDMTELENNSGGDRKNYVVAEIPMGIVFDNNFLRNLGPRIKVRMDVMGAIESELKTEVKPYGINNALVEVSVHLRVSARVILPFASKDVVIENIIPISINIVNGSIPEAYISTYK